MNKLLFQIVIGCLGVVLLFGCAGSEKRAQRLLAEAAQLIHSALEAEKSSYSDAFTLYQQALAKAETLTTQYPSSRLAGELAQGKVKIGSYTLTELKVTIIPPARLRAEAEESPLACALLVAETVPPLTHRILTETGEEILEKDFFAHEEMLAQIVDKYAQAGQCRQVLQVARTLGDPFSGDRIFVEIARRCAEAGHYDQALEAAAALEIAYNKAEVLAQIASKYAQAGQQEKAANLLFQSLQVAKTIENDNALDQIARKYAQAGQCEPALEIAKTVGNANVKAEMVDEIVRRCTEAGHYDQALRAAATLKDSPTKANILAGIAYEHRKAGRYDQALQVANIIPHPYIKVRVLTEIAGGYTRAGQLERTSEILFQALQVANAPEDAYFRAEALAATASAYTAVNQEGKAGEILSQALQVANTIKSVPGVIFSKENALSTIAGAYAEAGYYSQTLEIAHALKDTYPVPPPVFNAIRKYAAAGQYDRAVEIAEAILEDTASKTDELVGVADRCVRAGHKEKAAEILSRALQVAEGIEDESFKVQQLLKIAGIYMAIGGTEEAAVLFSRSLQLAGTLKNAYVAKDEVLVAMARHYVAAGYYDRALETADKIQNIFFKANELVKIARQYTQAGQYARAFQITTTVLNIGIMVDSHFIEEVLAEIARKYAQAGQYAQALEATKKINWNTELKGQVLTEIAAMYAQARHYHEALEVAERMDSLLFHTHVLAAIAHKYAESNQCDKALQIAEATRIATSKASLLAEIAGKCAKTGQREKASEILYRALQVTETEKDPSGRVEALTVIGFHYAKAGLKVDARAKKVLHEIIAGPDEQAWREQPFAAGEQKAGVPGDLNSADYFGSSLRDAVPKQE